MKNKKVVIFLKNTSEVCLTLTHQNIYTNRNSNIYVFMILNVIVPMIKIKSNLMKLSSFPSLFQIQKINKQQVNSTLMLDQQLNNKSQSFVQNSQEYKMTLFLDYKMVRRLKIFQQSNKLFKCFINISQILIYLIVNLFLYHVEISMEDN